MKKIEFYLLGIEPANNANKYHRIFRNSLISYDGNDFFFNSKFNQKEKISYLYARVELNLELVKTLERIFIKSMEEAADISSENMGKEIERGQLMSNLTSIVNKYSYLDTCDNKNFFDFVTEIFIRVLMGHYLNNGNKRIALTMLKAILWHFGYYLKFTAGMWKNYTDHKTRVEEFVRKLENKQDNDLEVAYLLVKQWIIKNVIIGLNWRRT